MRCFTNGNSHINSAHVFHSNINFIATVAFGRCSDYENPGSNPEMWFENLGQVVFTVHCSSSLSCINEYLTIDSGGYMYEHPSHINCSIWLNASQRSRNGLWVNMSVRYSQWYLNILFNNKSDFTVVVFSLVYH